MGADELVARYMEIFYSGVELERLYDILHDDLDFKGPLGTYTSSTDYISALIKDPPVNMSNEVVHCYRLENSICLYYHMHKDDVTLPMIQVFDVSREKIRKIRLFFDPTALS